MAKAEISWHSQDAAGNRRQAYAQHVGDRWIFYVREKRFDQWQRVDNPPLADWLGLLDAIERRIRRMLLRPEEAARIKKAIQEKFPGTTL